MATFLLSNAKLFLPSTSSSSSSSSSSTFHTQIVCRAAPTDPSSVVTTRRSISLSLSLSAAASLLFAANRKADAAILEADDDEELLEKVKKDRKKRLERQGVISSSVQETAYLQDVVYKLSKIGQAIEKNNLSEASSVVGSSKDSEWVKKVNSALNKLSSSEEEKTEVDLFNSSLTSLLSSISQNDIEGSKIAFVASATAFEKWTTLSGLSEKLKGL